MIANIMNVVNLKEMNIKNLSLSDCIEFNRNGLAIEVKDGNKFTILFDGRK